MTRKVFTLGADNSSAQAAIASMRGQKGPVKKLQVNISEDLHRSFKGTCVSKGLDMTEVIESLITGWLSEQE